jgi:hypothetical protein
LVDESHLFELFHVVADGGRRDIHTFIADEGFTACGVATFDIFSDNESENLDFAGIDGGLATVHSFLDLPPGFSWKFSNEIKCIRGNASYARSAELYTVKHRAAPQ